MQVHGGMGFIEETGAAQHYRDARIAAIYEGTNGIQAIDLVTRKMPLDGGNTVAAYIKELRDTVDGGEGQQRAGLRRNRRSGSAKRSTAWSARRMAAGAEIVAATRSPARRPICGCSAMPPAAACWPIRRSPRCATAAMAPARTALARFFAENIAVQASGLERSVTEGAQSITDAEAALA